MTQEPMPRRVVVVDNDPERSAEEVVRSLGAHTAVPIDYVAVGENRGPAHAWWRGFEHLRSEDDRGTWLAVFDDDDPVSGGDVVAELIGASADRPDLAAIGLRGAVLDRRRALLRRVDPPRGSTRPVDYLASGGVPLYRWAALDQVGFFEPDLFFGFEDLDLGLRLTRDGWGVEVLGSDGHVVADTASSADPWRDYYKLRALVWTMRRDVSVVAAVITIVRSALLGSLRLLVRPNGRRRAGARIRGAIDGWRGRLGSGPFVPITNPAKVEPAKVEPAKVEPAKVDRDHASGTPSPDVWPGAGARTAGGGPELDPEATLDLVVVVPCRNEGATLADQLDVLCAERWERPWGIVVVDDGSSDDTESVARSFADRGVRVVATSGDEQGGRGVGHARAVGAAAASARSVVFCDGDDLIWAGWVGAMGDALVRHELVSGRLETRTLNPEWLAEARPLSTTDGLPRFGAVPFASGATFGVRMALFRELGGFDESFVGLEDIELCLRARARGIVPVVASGALVAYRLRPDFRAIWRQGVFYGRGRPELIRRAGALGLPAPSRFEGLRSWAWLAVHLPGLRDRTGRRRWTWVLANRVGVLRGAWDVRGIYL